MENQEQQQGNQSQNPAPAPAPQPAAPAAPSAPVRDNWLLVATYILFFIPLIVEKLKKDEFFRFHMKQSLGLLIASVLAGIVDMFVPFIGGILQFAVFLLWAYSLWKALEGKQEPTPVIGEYFKKINI